MAHARLVALPCRISRGVFSTERAFEIDLPGGEIHVGFAPHYYFWNARGAPIRGDEATGDRDVKGLIAGRFVGEDGDLAIVSIPDGEAVAVRMSVVRDRPSEVTIHVPVRP